MYNIIGSLEGLPKLTYSFIPLSRMFTRKAAQGVIVVAALLYVGSSSVYADPMVQAPGGVANSSASISGVTIPPPPPSGFNPLGASDAELAIHGFPPKPDPSKDPVAYAHWSNLVTAGQDPHYSRFAANQHLSQTGPKFGSRGCNSSQTRVKRCASGTIECGIECHYGNEHELEWLCRIMTRPDLS